MSAKKTEPFLIAADEKFTFEVMPEDAKALDIVPDRDGTFHILQNEKKYALSLIAADYEKRTFTVEVNGFRHELAIADKYARLIEKLGLTVGVGAKQNTIKAPMPGLVLNIETEVGSSVKKGDALLILEAMKMENIIKAANDGVIKTIHVNKGQAVDKGTLLVEME